jgi:hypothetical protein
LPWAETGRPIRDWADSPIWRQGRDSPQRGRQRRRPIRRARRDEAEHRAEGEASELWTPIWGSGETMAHRGSIPCRGDSAEGNSRWQVGEEAGNAAEVAGERHGATDELGDANEAPNNEWRRLSAVVRSAAHDTEQNRHGRSLPWPMATGCRVGEVHHISVVLGEVPARTARARDHLSPMLASTASTDGRRLRGGLRLAAQGREEG